jgi:hypothetical protein
LQTHRGDGKRFVVHADEKLTAFVELESAIRVAIFCIDNLRSFFQNPRKSEDQQSKQIQ